jgi:hypothetical protein
MRISVVINGDTRPGLFESGPTGAKTTMSIDYLKEGVDNKLNFFRGHEVESHLYIDIHEPLSKEDLWDISQRVDDLTLHKHTEKYGSMDYYPTHIDLNMLTALIQARGDFVAHFDWDMAAFRNEGSNVVDTWTGWLNEGKYDYISYPSNYSPRASNDPGFNYDWASTRFFLCKRSALDHTEIMKCLNNAEYLYEKYGAGSERKCYWMEHILGMIAGKGRVFYPPLNVGDHMIFSWSKYFNGVFGALNKMSYGDVSKYVQSCAGIHYPCDVAGRQL